MRADANAIEGLEALKRIWLEQTREESARLAAAVDDGSSAETDAGGEVFRFFHDLQGQAGLFGYPLLAALGEAFCRSWRGGEGEAAPEDRSSMLRGHLAAVRDVLERKLEGPGGAAGHAIMAELYATRKG